VLGGDDVRGYPVELRDGDEVWVDVSDPPAEVVEAKILGGLRVAYAERDFARITREIARLHFHGLDPVVAVRRALDWAHDRLEYGSTHAQAATADWLALYDEVGRDGEAWLVCLTESVDHLAHVALRQPAFPFASATDERFTAAAFGAAVEAEDRKRAEGLVVRALADGLAWDELEPAFAAAALAHFNDFGHSAIYVVKAMTLVARLGSSATPAVALPLARSLCYATREDLLPEFSEYAGSLERLESAGGHAAFGAGGSGPPDAKLFFGERVRAALQLVVSQAAEHSALELHDALLETAARHLLHFDVSLEQAVAVPVSRSVGWLNLTHAVTFSDAVAELCGRHPHLWPAGLLQMACFTGRNAAYLDRDLDPSPFAVEDEEAFARTVTDRILDHGLRDPIFSAHILKTSRSVLARAPNASASCRSALLAALARFCAGPLKEKQIRRLAYQALALVGRDFA